MAISSWEWPEELGSCSADWRSPRPGACNAEKPPALRNGGGRVYRTARWQVSKGAVSAVAGPGVRGGGTSGAGAHAFGKLSLFLLSGEAFLLVVIRDVSPRLVAPPAFFIIIRYTSRPDPESLYFAPTHGSGARHSLGACPGDAPPPPPHRAAQIRQWRGSRGGASAPMTYCFSSGRGPNLKLFSRYFWCMGAVPPFSLREDFERNLRQ